MWISYHELIIMCFMSSPSFLVCWILGDLFIHASVLACPLEGKSKDECRFNYLKTNFTSLRSRRTVPPSFDLNAPRNVTTQLGQTVYLHCYVRSLGDKTVSWIRRRDFHLLTVGTTTYTADDRFQAVNMARSEDWMLQIKMAQVGDAGLYECQVNTHPLISFFITLTVLVPKALIREAPDLYVKTGSAINLTCVISQSPEPPVFVFWYHDDRMINYDSSGGDITIQKAPGDRAISRLFIRNAQTKDSGNYTCCPSNADATSISVHVLNGEKRAAMQHDLNTAPSSASLSTSRFRTFILSSIILVFFNEKRKS